MLDHLIDLIPALPSVVAIAAVAFAVFGVAALFEDENRTRRLSPVSVKETQGPSLRRGGSRMEQFVTRWFRGKFVPSDERQRTSLKMWLLQAGFDSSRAAQTFYGMRVILGAVLPALVILFLPIFTNSLRNQTLSAALLAAVVGFLLPVFWVSQRRRKRQREIRQGLPDILDLLLVCSEAGLGLDTAIARVGEETHSSQPLLSEQLLMITTEIRAGRARADAMRSFADRTGISETNSLVNLLIQSDTLGTSMAATLRVFADDMRAHRVLKAEEYAETISVKLSMVLVACFVPALVAAIMAPVIFTIIKAWKGIAI